MRKLYFKGLLASLLLLISANVFAYKLEVDGIYYDMDVNSLTAQVIKGEKPYAGIIEVPSNFVYGGKTIKVSAISSYAFKDCTELTSITIASPTISYCAFENCIALESVICNGVTSIENSAFKGCSLLTRVNLKGVVSIGGGAFKGCSMLKKITIPSSVETMEGRVFDSLEDLTLEYGLSPIEFPGLHEDEDERTYDTPFAGCKFKSLYIGRIPCYKYTFYSYTIPMGYYYVYRKYKFSAYWSFCRLLRA